MEHSGSASILPSAPQKIPYPSIFPHDGRVPLGRAILPHPGAAREINEDGMNHVARYLNESMEAICSYCKLTDTVKVDPLTACCRLSVAVGFEVTPEVLNREFKKRGWI